MKNRDGEAEAYVLWASGLASVREIRIARAAYIAGWNGRVQAELEAGCTGRVRPLHASAYEPLTPFKPKPVEVLPPEAK